MNQTPKDYDARKREINASLDKLHEGQMRLQMHQTPAGKLLVRYGFEPYDTESAARRVAEKAAWDIAKLEDTITHLRGQLAKLAAYVP